MTVLELNFPAGRYHATPWGRHVNEGAVEWPPSPWRIVRALIATWYLKARIDQEIPEHTIRALANALSQSPMFRLPRATTAHTRHYMPYNEGKYEKTTKVFDTFSQLSENDPVIVAWNVTLPPEQLEALRKLAERLGYLGRAESLVIARVLDGITAIEPNASPLAEGAPLPEKTELVRLLAPMTPERYVAWRGEFIAANITVDDKKKKKKEAKTEGADEESVVPRDLFKALHAETSELQAAGWNLPPGAEFVNYTRSENAFAPAMPPRATWKKSLPTVARYAVVSTVPPRITQAVSIGDRVHDALCKWSDQGHGRAIVFTGLEENGKPRSGHQHAHIFCEANGPRDVVTHITVWAPMGFNESACLALRRLNKVWGYGGHDLRLVLHSIGQPEEFPDCKLFKASTDGRKARIWRSLTPFVSTLHAKVYRDGRPKLDPSGWQQGSAGHDLLRQLAKHLQGAGAKIRQLDERTCPFHFGNRHLRSLQFQIHRDGEGRRGNGSGSAFEITFSEPVTGPLALGYGAHFGLGLFVPVSNVETPAASPVLTPPVD